MPNPNYDTTVEYEIALNQPQKKASTRMEIIPPDPLAMFMQPEPKPSESVPTDNMFMKPESDAPRPTNTERYLTVDEDQAQKLKKKFRKDLRQKKLMTVLNRKRSPTKLNHSHQITSLHDQPKSGLFQQKLAQVFKLTTVMTNSESQTEQSTPTDLPMQLLKSQDLLDQKRSEIKDLYIKLDKEQKEVEAITQHAVQQRKENGKAIYKINELNLQMKTEKEKSAEQ